MHLIHHQFRITRVKVHQNADSGNFVYSYDLSNCRARERTAGDFDFAGFDQHDAVLPQLHPIQERDDRQEEQIPKRIDLQKLERPRVGYPIPPRPQIRPQVHKGRRVQAATSPERRVDPILLRV